ncbi:TIGR03620 family F420-dependent LLM class oxidoreductase [Amycolatopsis sp. GM8]|uniref:TIGR03620 family F420-dependent LLM class oxidoreductase n=1 Tax=Amycolatopsis sp. GM8 TaxID=2896530 RepID=UPI001EFF844B|nr:TIGR03620 family F420-dependent LLM class oxidoreductase [Amycolatopsis sp. GM8]
MENSTVLGRVGVALPITFSSTPHADLQRDAAAKLEAAGYGTAWTNEVLGKDALVQLGVLLAATERMTFGTGVANIWVRAPQTTHAAAALLAQAHPGRFALGLGVGYPQQAEAVGREFGSPLATMRDYVSKMDEPTWPPAADGAYPRLIAANGPKMLALAAEIADGALPATRPTAFTVQAREILGPGKLLVMGLTVIPDGDRAAARAAVAPFLAMPNAVASFAGLDFTEQDVTEASDRLVDALVAYGSPDRIAAKVREHLAAGADHVELMLPIDTDYATGVDQFVELAPALTSL